MLFSRLSHYFEIIEKEASRLAITEHLSDLFKELTPAEFRSTMYLLQGRVAPMFNSLEFGIAEKLISKAAISSMNLDTKYFTSELKKTGDLGQTVESFKKQYVSFEQEDLSIEQVFERLYDLAGRKGSGSQDQKLNILAHLIAQSDPLSSRYLVRIPVGQMRLGFSDMTVLDAFSWMITGDKSLRSEIESAYHVRPDLGYIGQELKKHGAKGLSHVKPELFTPILMMRAERLSSGEEIIEKIGACRVESKYDGFRLQIHVKKVKNSEGKSTSEVRLYSRNLEDVTHMYPDLVRGVAAQVKVNEAIIEGEAIGYDPHTNKLLPFQQTVQRKRKYDIEEKAKEIPLRLFVFELLYVDGESYISEPFESRRKKLSSLLDRKDDVRHDVVVVAKDEVIDDPIVLEQMFDDAIEQGLEGIVAKKRDGVYQAGARGWNWIKLKRSYSSKIDDTIDCLVMGYDYGKGRRSGFGIGAFLVGVLDEEKDVFVTVSKVGTGLSDEQWHELKRRSDVLKSKKTPPQYEVDKAMKCDVWIDPKIVVEIKADEVTRSATHTAGRIMKSSKSGSASMVDESGYALRFPRLIRFRDDRLAQDATTLSEVKALYKSQKV